MTGATPWNEGMGALAFESVPGIGDPIVLLHGFTQTARSWRPIAERLDTERPVVAVDAPGHGRSADVVLGLLDTARAVADIAPRSTLVGYSMGGRVALHLAIHQPAAVERLVLIGATPGIEDPTERAERRAADERLATRLELIGVDAFLDEWLAQPLFADLAPSRRDLDDRRRNTVAGLAASLRNSGTGTQESLWARLSEIHVPTLVITGGRDDKFTEIGRRMVDAIGREAHLVTIPDRGHAVHLEDPDRVAEVVGRFVVT